MNVSGSPLERIEVAIALGSNLGDREATLRSAVAALDALPLTDLRRVSRFHETEPVGLPGQGRYLNAAAILATGLPPRRLLEALLEIERQHGRVRTGLRNGPRTLDLDLTFYGDLVLSEGGLEVPHPRFTTRRFVLAPLAEIAPHWRHPVVGVSVDSLLRRLDEPAIAVPR
jgi:2-amino-4-hydroxy-6-hydroxymethyldihydropteridine diphosphokinase